MNNSVIIKGNKYGIVVVLDDKIPFAQLREDIANKFKSATKFLIKPIWQFRLKVVNFHPKKSVMYLTSLQPIPSLILYVLLIIMK